MSLFKKKQEAPVIEEPENDEPTEADQALAQSRAHLEEVESNWPAVRSEAAWHRWRRPQNHFARDLDLLFSGKDPE